jgi:uncharacterized OB-fold protein
MEMIGQPVVKRWYDALNEDKMLGLKCARCGALEFPPVCCCNSCSGIDMEWTEISGKAKMLDFVLPSPLFLKEESADLGPYCYGTVELDEGPRFNAIVVGVSNENAQEMNTKLPLPVNAEIVQRDGFRTLVFRLAG